MPGCAATRRIAADPTSAALLLAGPTAVELWPGAELTSSGPDDQIRVMVDPGVLDDEAAALISHEIATAVEREMEYPGRIKITVIRESRATTFAK